MVAQFFRPWIMDISPLDKAYRPSSSNVD